MTSSSGLQELRRLASLYGVQTAYYSADHQRRPASAQSLVAVLKGLGAAVEHPGDAPAALRERQQELLRRVVEPVTVAWDGRWESLEVRLPRSLANGQWQCRLTLEDGREETWPYRAGDLPATEAAPLEGIDYSARFLPGREGLPPGYHRLTLAIPGLPPAETLIISAPTRAYSPFEAGENPSWGAFLPLYALRRRQGPWPYGDFTQLENLAGWTGSLGGGIVATLPILAAFLDQPFEPSPYAPVSRLLWNEFYLDVTRAPELADCAPARAILESDSYIQEVEELRRSPLVDYARGMALKRRVLEELARHCWQDASGRAQALQGFLTANSLVEDYARFRATGERRRETWPSWPEPLRSGRLDPGNYDEAAMRYHAYVQWLAHEQVRELARQDQDRGVSLYLDLPVGVHPHGFDVWRRPDLFARSFTVGAPPDLYFTNGQSWGFPPLHPDELRRSGYDYFRAYLRHHFEAAGLLRIDHVMGLHRLFWVPQGFSPSQGLYVRYPEEEFYAILSLESHRNRAGIIGEDLGTVPPGVRPAMRRHGLYSMYVAYFEMSNDPSRALRPAPANTLASINTHDLPPFSAFWQGRDIQYRRELGHQSPEGARKELQGRQAVKAALVRFLQRQGLLQPPLNSEPAILKALLAWLGNSRAPMVLVNLEDLWLEAQPQNIPGTGPEQPNWRLQAQYSLEEFSQMPQVAEVLRELSSLRHLAQHQAQHRR
jgi:4-alpha-glucanotransferase